MLVAAGFGLMLAAVAISHYQVLCHLRNYTEPLFQVSAAVAGRGRAAAGAPECKQGRPATPPTPALTRRRPIFVPPPPPTHTHTQNRIRTALHHPHPLHGPGLRRRIMVLPQVARRQHLL